MVTGGLRLTEGLGLAPPVPHGVRFSSQVILAVMSGDLLVLVRGEECHTPTAERTGMPPSPAFWHQGQVSWKTVFTWTRRGGGPGMIQAG